MAVCSHSCLVIGETIFQALWSVHPAHNSSVSFCLISETSCSLPRMLNWNRPVSFRWSLHRMPWRKWGESEEWCCQTTRIKGNGVSKYQSNRDTKLYKAVWLISLPPLCVWCRKVWCLSGLGLLDACTGFRWNRRHAECSGLWEPLSTESCITNYNLLLLS